MRKRIGLIINVLLIVGLVAFGGWYFKKYRDVAAHDKQVSAQLEATSKELETFKTNPTEASKAETKKIVAEVGKLYALPKEDPTNVYTVNDKETAKKTPFFEKAENGDIALIYSNSKLAILYRPSSKQLINVGSITIQDQAPVPAEPAVTPAP